MRITGGTAKGHQLKVPNSKLVRPTTDRAREAVFSILASLATSWSRGLDLFAGTGALGIEALSRDVEWVDFVDQDHRCCAIIKQNLEKVGLAARAHVYGGPMILLLPLISPGPFSKGCFVHGWVCIQ